MMMTMIGTPMILYLDLHHLLKIRTLTLTQFQVGSQKSKVKKRKKQEIRFDSQIPRKIPQTSHSTFIVFVPK